jgi:recombination protein RecT
MANHQLSIIDQFKNQITENQTISEQLTNLLEKSSFVSKSAFITSLIDLYAADSKLRECNPVLVIHEAMKAASLQLPISKSLGYAYLIPYKKGTEKIPQFQIGYKGYIQLAIRTNQYSVINADVVYEGQITRNDKLRGFIELNGERKNDNVVGFFAYIELKGGFSKMFYMTVEQVKTHAEKYSSSWGKEFSPWNSDFNAMSLKTVLKYLLSHYGFLSAEMQKAFDQDNEDNTESIGEKIKAATAKPETFKETEDIAHEEIKPETKKAKTPF